jgi:hypothetical protein
LIVEGGNNTQQLETFNYIAKRDGEGRGREVQLFKFNNKRKREAGNSHFGLAWLCFSVKCGILLFLVFKMSNLRYNF